MLLLGLFGIDPAQPTDILWTKTFGGTNFDEGRLVQQTLDGGYIIVGYTESYGAGGQDAWLVKTDANGDTIWTKTYGGTQNEMARSVQQTSDGGYIITGKTNSYGAGNYDFWLVKTDANGDTVWTKTYGGPDYDYGFSVQQTSDGGYIVTGWTWSYGAGEYDIWLIKTDANGDTTWTRTFGGIYWDWAYSVQQTSDGGYIITGYTESYGAGGEDVWLIKTNANGDTLWTKTFGGPDDDRAFFGKQTSDGGYIITGRTYSYGAGNYDLWLIKTNANGDTLWTKTFGGTGSDAGFSVQETIDGGYIIVGQTYSYGAGGGDFWLVKTDANGNTMWTKTFGGTNEDRGYSVQQTSDGGYIITGYTWSYGAGAADLWLIKTTSDIAVEEAKSFTPERLFITASSNLSKDLINIWYANSRTGPVLVTVYNLAGQKVATLVDRVQDKGIFNLSWRPINLGSGVYFLSLKTSGGEKAIKVILNR